MIKLELKHWSAYLPYKLQIKCTGIFYPNTNEKPKTKGASATLTADLLADIEAKIFDNIGTFKPILKPLSNLTGELMCRFIDEFFNGSISVNEDYSELQFMYDLNNGIIKLNFYQAIEIKEWLLKNHFDIFGLIEAKLAININDIKL